MQQGIGCVTIEGYYILDSIKGLMIGKYICRTKDEGTEINFEIHSQRIRFEKSIYIIRNWTPVSRNVGNSIDFLTATG